MIAAAVLLYLGLFTIAASNARQGRVLLGRHYSDRFARLAPMAGWILLAASLLPVILAPRWGYALIEWLGLVALLGGGILLSLTYGALPARAAIVAALASLCLFWAV